MVIDVQLRVFQRLAEFTKQRQPAQMGFVPARFISGNALLFQAALIEGQVGSAQERLRLVTIVRIEHHPEVDVDSQMQVVQLDIVGKAFQQRLRPSLHLVLADLPEHQGEFIAAQACDPIVRAGLIEQAPPHFGQYPVAHFRAQGIVHPGEVVNIQHHQGKALFGPGGFFYRGLQLRKQLTAIDQAGELIVPGLIQNLLLAFGDGALHPGESLGQLPELIPGAHRHRRVVVTPRDTAGHVGQRAHRLGDAARKQYRQQRGNDGEAQGDPQQLAVEPGKGRHDLFQWYLQHRRQGRGLLRHWQHEGHVLLGGNDRFGRR